MKIKNNYPNGEVLWFHDFYLLDNNIIFSAGNFNALYEYSMEEKKLKLLGHFKNENILEKQLYGKIYKYFNELTFIPLGADNIAIYNLDNGKFDFLPLPIPNKSCGVECKFLNSIKFNKKIFMFPGYASYILEYNLEKKELIVQDNWYDDYINKWGKRSFLLFNYDMVVISNDIYLPSEQHNGLFKYSLDNNKYEFIEIDGRFNKVLTLTFDGKYLWCTTDSKKLLKMDKQGNIVDEIDLSHNCKKEDFFVRSIYDNGYLWIFISQQSVVLKIDCSNPVNNYEFIRYAQNEKSYTNLEYHAVNFVEKKNNKIIFMARTDRKLNYISNRGEIDSYLERIVDTTGYSEKNINSIEMYKLNLEIKNRENKYFKEKRSIAFLEQTEFSETIKFLKEEINYFDKKYINYLDNNIGLNIFKECKIKK